MSTQGRDTTPAVRIPWLSAACGRLVDRGVLLGGCPRPEPGERGKDEDGHGRSADEDGCWRHAIERCVPEGCRSLADELGAAGDRGDRAAALGYGLDHQGVERRPGDDAGQPDAEMRDRQ